MSVMFGIVAKLKLRAKQLYKFCLQKIRWKRSSSAQSSPAVAKKDGQKLAIIDDFQKICYRWWIGLVTLYQYH